MTLSPASSLPVLSTVRPLLILTGFLGAGKTTLLRALLTATREAGYTTDVILNDYADATLDGATLEGLTHTLSPLTAACACCEGLDFLLELALQSADSGSDLLCIELNGTADPIPIIESFTLLEHKLKRHPRWQICVIHPDHFRTQARYEDIETLQLQTASHIYFSHTDTAPVSEELLGQVREINPSANIISLADLQQAVCDLAQRMHARLLSPADGSSAGSPRDLLTLTPQHHATHDFTACQLPLPASVEKEQLLLWLTSLPTDVIRAKVLVGINGRKGRYLYERIGTTVSKYVQRVALNAQVPNSAILIGPDLDPTALSIQAEALLRNAE